MKKSMQTKSILTYVLQKILIKIFYFKTSISQNPIDNSPTRKRQFETFNINLRKKTNTRHELHHRLRYHEIEKYINTYNLKRVLEMGSGRTTFIFNSIPGVQAISVEQDVNWKDIITPLLFESGLSPDIRVFDVHEYKEGGKFVDLPDYDCDLFYIDGPAIERIRKFDTFTGKEAHYDFETLFSRGVFPKVIMIEGRTDTADAIIESNHADKYRFYGEFSHSIERKRWLSALRFQRHSIFIRK